MEIKGYQLNESKYSKIFMRLMADNQIRYLIASLSMPISTIGKEKFLTIYRNELEPYLKSVSKSTKLISLKQIFDRVKTIIKFDWKKHLSQYKIENKERNEHKANIYTSLIDEELNNDSFKNKMIIDIGSMNGTITSLIVNKYKFKGGYFTDLIEPSQKVEDDKLTFVKNSVNEIPIKANKDIKLITLFHVFHHMSDVPNMMKEIKRLSNKGGYLLIVDHDVNNNRIFHELNLIHGLYEYVREESPQWFTIKNGYYAKYYNKLEIIKVMKKYNFELVKYKPYSKKYDNQNRYMFLFKYN